MQPTSIRLPPDLRAWLTAKAAADSRSLSSQIVQTLRAAMTSEPLKESTE
jgi:hypothetical protein